VLQNYQVTENLAESKMDLVLVDATKEVQTRSEVNSELAVYL
jgi:hypothetical protein